MDINVETKTDCTATLTATILAAETKQERQSIISSYQAQAKIPGFRPGKVPAKTIEKRFDTQITEELLAKLFDKVCTQALEDNQNLKVLNFGTPDHSIEDDGTYKAITTLTIVPDFELPDYKGIEVTVPSDDINEEDVEKSMADLAQRMADFKEVERSIKLNDVAIIDFTSSLEGKPVAEVLGKPAGFIEGRENQWMPVEEDSFLPGLAKGLIGLNAGDQKDIQVTMNSDFPISDLQEKTVTFHVTVKEVREKEVPEINEDFAERIMPGKSVDELRELMRNDLISRKKHEIDGLKADQLTEKLADTIDFPIPEALVENESHGIIQQKMQQLVYSGTPQSELEGKMEEIRKESKEEATRNLKVYFMLQEIANKEQITVSDQELGMEIMQQAQREKKNPKTYIRQLQKEGRIHGIRMSLLTAKVIDFLVKEANVKVSA